jgi:hypothetical protein
MGTHAKLSCNECHAPHNLLAKLPFKAQEGHSTPSECSYQGCG